MCKCVPVCAGGGDSQSPSDNESPPGPHIDTPTAQDEQDQHGVAEHEDSLPHRDTGFCHSKLEAAGKGE